MTKALILGPGRRNEVPEWTGMSGTIYDNYDIVHSIDINPLVYPTFVHDLTSMPWPCDYDYDAIHAYEVMEHITKAGDVKQFFTVWGEVWRRLNVGGKFYGSTPWWRSVWAWSDPGHTQVYSPQLLLYLTQDYYIRPEATEYRHLWVYDFKIEMAGMYSDSLDQDFAGLAFILEKRDQIGAGRMVSQAAL